MADRENNAPSRRGIDGLHRQRVAAAVSGDLAGQDDVDAFTHGDQPGPGFIELSVGPEPGNGPLRIQPRVGRNERRSLERDRQRLFQRSLEHRLPGPVPEIRDQEGQRRARRRRRRRSTVIAGEPDRGPRRQQHEHQHRRGRGLPLVFLGDGPGPRAAGGVERLERVDQRLGGRVAAFRLGLQAGRDDALERFGHVRRQPAQRRRRRLHPRHHFRHRALRSRDTAAAGQHVVEHQPERVVIGAVIDGGAARLLGRHVFERAHDRAAGGGRRGAGRHRSRDPEVHDQRLAVLVDHDVLGLEIAVHDAGLVRGGQSRGDVLREDQRLRRRQLAAIAQQVGEVLPLDVRHRDVLDAVDLPEVVDPHDVLVRDLPGQQQLALEAPLDLPRDLRIPVDFGADDLQRDGDAELGVPGLVNDAHAAGPELSQNAIARPERLAGGERPGRGPGRSAGPSRDGGSRQEGFGVGRGAGQGGNGVRQVWHAVAGWGVSVPQ